MDSNDENIPYEVLPKVRYFFSLCGLCYKYVPNMKSCSQCKTVVYCCKRHQVRDWKNHKSMCKAIAVTRRELENFEVNNFKEFRNLQELRRRMWTHFLERNLTQYENEMWMFPRVCAVCYTDNTPVICTSCLNVAYCSDMHRKIHKGSHKQYCKLLKFAMIHEIQNSNETPNLIVGLFEDKIKSMPDSFEEFLKASNKSNVMYRRGTSTFAAAATILYGLEKACIVVNRDYEKKDLVVHVVGASLMERTLMWESICELAIHWLKNIDNIYFYLIGPELSDAETTDLLTKTFCDRCKIRKVKGNCCMLKGLYHNIKSSIRDPDLIVCFNSGIHEYHSKPDDTWIDSVKPLIENSNTPLLLTAYAQKEIMQDLAIIKADSTVQEILAPQRNPFHDPFPLREFEVENEPVYYCNGWISILMREE